MNILGGRATDGSHTHGGAAVIAVHTQTRTISIERGGQQLPVKGWEDG